MNNSFEIFVPQEKFRLTYQKVFYGLIIICIVLILINLFVIETNESVSTLINFIVVVLIITYFILILASYFIKQPLNGYFSGKMIINPESIVLNSDIINFSEIEKIRLDIGTYNDQKIRDSRSISPKILNGTDNVIYFTFTDGTRSRVYFRQDYPEHYMSIQPLVISLVRSKKISVLKATIILGINDYDEIQVFKSEINKKELHS